MLDTSQHQMMLVEILQSIFSNSNVRTSLGFKGGTAGMLFYGLPRFSVDLDFDLLDEQKAASIFEEIKTILQQYGKIQDAAEKRFNLLFQLSYKGKKERGQNIKVEINKRNFGASYELKSHLGIPMTVMV